MSGALPETYKAATACKGKPVEIAHLPTPKQLKDGHLLVKIQYAGVNPMDGKLYKSNMWNLPEPMILGFEWSGIVAAVGKNTKYPVGQAVFGYSLTSQCFAEYLVVPESTARAKPDFVDSTVACMAGIGYTTAYESAMYVLKLNERKGQTIFIQGAGGAVGSMVAMMAKRHGLVVIGSTSKPQTREFLLNKLKLDHVVDYKDPKVYDEVMRLTNGKGCDVVYDPTYSTGAMNQSATFVAKDGVWCRLGSWSHGNALDEQARKIVKERGASETFGDCGRYWGAGELVKNLPTLWDVSSADFIASCKAGLMHAQIIEVPLEAKAVEQAMDDSLNAKQSGRILIKP